MNVAMLLKPKSMVSYIYADLTASEGLKEFIAGGYTAVPVIDRAGMYIGVVSERDFLYYMLKNKDVDLTASTEITVDKLICSDRFQPVQIDADMDMLFSRIIEQNFVPVIDSGGMFSGIVTRRDVLIKGKYGERK